MMRILQGRIRTLSTGFISEKLPDKLQLYIGTQRRIFYGNCVRKHNEISIDSREAEVEVLAEKFFALI